MNILIINSGELPLPPVEGGAVEGLIDIYVKYLQHEKNMSLTIYSKYTKEAQQVTKNYNNNVIFKFVDTSKIQFKIEKVIRYILNKISFCYLGNAYIVQVLRLLKKERKKYDLIIVENAPCFGLKLKHKYSKKIVLHLHNDYLNQKTRYKKQILHCYDQIWSISNFIKERVNSIENNNKNHVLYNGINLEKFYYRPKNKELIKKFNIKKEEIIFICSGRLVPEKGILELVKAYKKAHINKSQLIIIGSPSYGKNSKTKYTQTVLDEVKDCPNIKFTGYIKHEDINKFYSIGDVGIVPSKCNEAFGLSAVEFMASGLPVIVSNDGALPEIINKSCGKVIEKENLEENLEYEIKRMYKQEKEEREKFKKNAISQSKKFSQDIYCKKIETLIWNAGDFHD